MRVMGALHARLSARGWPVASAPAAELIWIALVDLVTLLAVVAALAAVDPGRRDLQILTLLLAIAIGFEEIARRAARLRLRLSKELVRDTASLWAIAGAVALTPGSAVVLVVAIRVHIWFRQQRPANGKLYRKWFGSATEVLGMLLAGQAVHASSHSWGVVPGGLPGAAAVVVAILVFAVVNRGLVTVAVIALGARGRALVGSLEENLIELATLSLGGLVALAAVHQLWLAVLVVAPMYALQRGALVRELETAAMTDSKTGLLNAVAWEQLGQREIARAERQGSGLAVLLLDIDRFKSVNDRFGHLVGDKILHQIARTMASAMRDYDTLGRFGGEEFVAVLPDVDEISALAIAERTRVQVAALRISRIVETLGPLEDDALAVSIGVALMPTDGSELTDLLHSADRALYEAKASGRNQVKLASRGTGGMPVPLPFA